MSSEEIANVQQADPKENGEQEAPAVIHQEQQQHETKEVHISLYAWGVNFMTLCFSSGGKKKSWTDSFGLTSPFGEKPCVHCRWGKSGSYFFLTSCSGAPN